MNQNVKLLSVEEIGSIGNQLQKITESIGLETYPFKVILLELHLKFWFMLCTFVHAQAFPICTVEITFVVKRAIST